MLIFVKNVCVNICFQLIITYGIDTGILFAFLKKEKDVC